MSSMSALDCAISVNSAIRQSPGICRLCRLPAQCNEDCITASGSVQTQHSDSNYEQSQHTQLSRSLGGTPDHITLRHMRLFPYVSV